MNTTDPSAGGVPTSIAIDEEGYVLSGDLRVQDPVYGQEILKNISTHEGLFVTRYGVHALRVEAFSEPYVAQRCELDSEECTVLMPYEFMLKFDLSTLFVDEWDRFHGLTETGVPFVFSRAAQVDFFNQLDSFEDDSITYNGREYPIEPFFQTEKKVERSAFWSEIYNQGTHPGWDLGAPAPGLIDLLPRLKLSKARVLVLGCGRGHDAAFFARNGHLVTAVDFSADSLEQAKALYGGEPNLHFVQADAFKLDSTFTEGYDVIFEHTCFCAVNPEKRQELVKVWERVLTPGGFLLGIFFVDHKRDGPPFGGSEWEMRQRLQKYFRFLFWNRLGPAVYDRAMATSPSPAKVKAREGRELLVYAQKLR